METNNHNFAQSKHKIHKKLSTSSENSTETTWESPHHLIRTVGRDLTFASLSENFPKSQESEDSHLELILEKKIGEGAYGCVYRAIQKQNGKFIAVKIIRIDLNSPNWHEKLEVLEEEISLLRRFDHPNIVRYIGKERYLPKDSPEGEVRIFMQYMAGGSLSSIIKQYGALSETIIVRFTKQIVLGLHYLHSHGVVHRDLKGANILADSDGNVKLADFGASKHIMGLPLLAGDSELCKSIRGSLYWMAPEILKKERYGRKVDIWSLGCVVIEMATGTHPWKDVHTYAELCLAVAQQQTPQIPENLSETCKNFVSLTLDYNKKQRPNTSFLLKHAFLA